MIPINSREKGIQFQAAAKQEDQNNNNNNVSSSSTTTTTSRQWPGFRNPRIVRVSRTFGGKDRHSKVSTVRGLRDRRIRLSVPTAVQLYDLQDRLGLSQPSKVVDWLLDVTEHDIDKLPPLQVPHGLFGHHYHQIINPHHHPPPNNNNSLGSFAPFFDQNQEQLRMLGNGGNEGGGGDQKGKSIIKTNDDNEQEDHRGHHNLHHHHHPSSIPGLLNNGMAYNYFHNFSEQPSSNLSLSQFGSHGFTQAPQIDHNAIPFSAPMPPSLGTGPQLFFGPSTATLSSLFGPFPPYLSSNPLVEGSGAHEGRQASSHFQFLSSSSGSSQNLVPNNNSLVMPSLHSISSSLRSFGPNNPYKQQLSSQNNNNGGSRPNKNQH